MEPQYVTRQTIDNRPLNTPSPVVFPSASPTPKLYTTPSKKVPDIQQWQEFGIESFPQMYKNNREKANMSISNDSVFSDPYFNEEEYLSSLISSTATSPSPLRRPASFHSPSPLQNEPIIGSPLIKETVADPIVERPRRFSESYTEPEPVNSVSSKLNLFISKMKKATSGKRF